ncbi:hypothetical protein EB796_023828 [Bugula neritina]|uniref:Uncharacterized protein n=1 Tax=Bugula neritina TaxID=10212 RepID=A0A7J7IVK5_BUGNE|nr:hypothetical protein EB796_023828 [Bugula neritina]
MSPTQLRLSLRDTQDASRSRQSFQSNNNRLQRSRSRSLSPVRSGRVTSPYRSHSPPRYHTRYSSRQSDYSSDGSLELELNDSSFKEKMYRENSKLATWSTHPVHLRETTKPDALRNSVRMSRRRSRSPSPYGSSLRGTRVSSSPLPLSSRLARDTDSRLYEEFPVTSVESLAKDNFPVTMSAYKIDHVEPPMSRSMASSPPPKHLRPKSPHKWRVDGKVNDQIRGIDYADFDSTYVDNITKMYSLSDVAPSIAAGTVHMISPYASDLAQLRLSRLKIEEDHLLEAKRLAEIERLRGPQKQWYALKTPDFHYEAHKNNELINNEKRWEKSLDYRKSMMS